MDSPRPARILLVGVGGIGGSLAAALQVHAGTLIEELVPLTRNEAVAHSISERGFVLRGVDGVREVPGQVWTQLPDDGRPFDFIFLATQPPQVEEAARTALPLLAEDGRFVCFQNGLCEDRIAAVAGVERVLGAIVTFGASMPEPGVFERTSAGGFTIGSPSGLEDPRLRELSLLLEAAGPVELTSNLPGARWSKLAINCAISTLGTLGGDRLGVLMRARLVRRLALELMTETVAVARASSVALEKVSGTMDLDWLALTESEQASRTGSPGLVAKHALLLAVGTRYRRMRSSMLRAIERGRPPAVDFLNGEIVERGRRLKIPVPFNEAAVRHVHSVAAGDLEMGRGALEALARDGGLRAFEALVTD